MYVDGSFTSPFDATCFVALTEKGVPFTTARALLRDGQGVPVGITNRTAIARIPALQHGDFWLNESMAIAEYLEEAFPPPSYPRLFPAELRARARARQIMAWTRFDLSALRDERPWWMVVYRATPAPLSKAAQREAGELVDLVVRLCALGELGPWNISHADLALNLLRLARTEYPLPAPAQQFLTDAVARPSLRAYLDHPRPPNPPPAPPRC